MIEGNAARDRHDWPAAAEAYRAHLRIRPDNFPIWVQLGHSLKESGQREAALEAYHAALRLRPDDADLLLNLGHLHKIMGRRTQAIDYYSRSARLDPVHDVLEELRALGADPGDIPDGGRTVEPPPTWLPERSPSRPEGIGWRGAALADRRQSSAGPA